VRLLVVVVLVRDRKKLLDGWIFMVKGGEGPGDFKFVSIYIYTILYIYG
jgi:hypothetical protein